jgi:hypothetical protein
MDENKNLSDEKIDEIALQGAFNDYYKKKMGKDYDPNQPNDLASTQPPSDSGQPTPVPVPPQKINVQSPENFQSKMSQETDPDLMMSYEMVELPSKGDFYVDKLDKVKIEYLTSRDEDILTTPSLIEDGTIMDVLFERKIKTPNVNASNLLSGDRNAISLFLRASSYGYDYEVQVTDPRSGKPFNTVVDLGKLKYKEGLEQPDSNQEFSVDLPMRKKTIKFKLLTSGEEKYIYDNAEARKDAYNLETTEYNTLKLIGHVTEVNGNRDKLYIQKFIDVMPALDALTIRRKVLDVTPDVDMNYEFKTNDGYKFKAPLAVGIDFFFPSL